MRLQINNSKFDFFSKKIKFTNIVSKSHVLNSYAVAVRKSPRRRCVRMRTFLVLTRAFLFYLFKS